MSKRSPAEVILIGISLFVFLAIVLMAPLVVYADNGHGHDHGSNTTAVDVTTGGVDVATGDVSVGGNSSRALALGNTLGDVDIAGCLGSTQWSTPVYGKQKLVVNWVCVAEFYIRYQQPELAAMALCNTEILKEFDTEEECEQAHQFLAQAVIQTVDESEDEDEEVHEALHSTNMMLQAEIEELRELYERHPTQRPVVVQMFSDDQKARLREVVK